MPRITSCIISNAAPYSGSVASAQSPMTICTTPRKASGLVARSMRPRTQYPPQASPRMNADSISSNECVAAPSTSVSIRIQPTS